MHSLHKLLYPQRVDGMGNLPAPFQGTTYDHSIRILEKLADIGGVCSRTYPQRSVITSMAHFVGGFQVMQARLFPSHGSRNNDAIC